MPSAAYADIVYSVTLSLEGERKQYNDEHIIVKFLHTSKEGVKYGIVITQSRTSNIELWNIFVCTTKDDLRYIDRTAFGDITLQEDSNGTISIYQMSRDGGKYPIHTRPMGLPVNFDYDVEDKLWFSGADKSF